MRINIKLLLILGIIGSCLWVISDYMIYFLPNGFLKGSLLTDNELLSVVLKDAPLWRFTTSAIVQSLGMVLVMLGYLSISFILHQNKIMSILSLIGGMMSAILGAVYHVIYVVAVWYYIKGGMTLNSYELFQNIFDANNLLMTICGLGFTLLGVVLFIAVVKGKTNLPKWACIFNLMIVYIIFDFFKFPAHISTGCVIMFVALYVFEKNKYIELTNSK